MPETIKAQTSKMQAVLLITVIMLGANVLSDLSLIWPESYKDWFQFLASRVSSALLVFLALWAATDPAISKLLGKAKIEGETRKTGGTTDQVLPRPIASVTDVICLFSEKFGIKC